MSTFLDKLKANQNKLLLWAVFFIGFYYLPFRVLGAWELSMIPGDLGDSVFNLVVLENGYQFLFGSIDNFWQSNFFHPFNNPIALSDNLIGTLPIYIIFRLFGLDYFTAFQFWILALFALNYFFSYKAFKRLTQQPLWAILGAYIFAFGFYNLNFISHLQLLPRFILPFIFVWLIEFMFYKKHQSFYFFLGGIVFQFYCGMYLGFFTVLTSFAFLLSYFLIYKNLDFTSLLFNRKHIKASTLLLIASFISILPLVFPYYKMSTVVGTRDYVDIIENIPSIHSYFFSHPASKPWNPILFDFGVNENYKWWDHTNFVGIIPWLAFFTAPILWFRNKKNTKLIGFLILVVIVFLLLFSKFGELSFYQIIHQIPGLNSMRAINRIVIPLLIILIIIGIILLNKVSKYNSTVFAILFIVVFLDNDYHLSWDVNRFNKMKSKAMVGHIKNHIDRSESNVIAFKISDVENSIYEKRDYFNISCMLASIDEDIKIVNGYSSMAPPYFEEFLQTYSAEGILEIKNAYKLEKEIATVQIKSFKKLNN